MRIWLTRLMWLSAIFLLVWVAVIIYWQSTSRLPSGTDIALYLGVLPLGLAALGFGVYKIATRPKAEPSAQAGAQAAQPVADANKAEDERERAWTLNIVATSLQTSAGMSASEVLGKLQQGDVPSELDPELKNKEGYGVFSARIPDLDATSTQEALATWQESAKLPELTWTDGQYRALHLAAAAVNELAGQASEHPEVQRYWQLKEEGKLRKEDSVVPLRLVALWPKIWSDAHQQAASGWLKSLVVAQGWPEHRIVMQDTKSEQANPISLLDYINVSAHRAQLPTVGILVVADSAIDPAYVSDLAEKNQLYSTANMQGLRPGELAAGLLFADKLQSRLLGEGPFSSLHRASWAAREKSADEKGRITADLLGQLTDLALQTAKLEAGKIKLASTDNDHKTSRESELFEMLNAKLPELDLNKDIAKVAQACGSMSHGNTAAALCLAHQYVVDEQAPVLCASLHDPLLRAAVVLSVPAEKTDNPSAEAQAA
jgi:hypothetical protein